LLNPLSVFLVVLSIGLAGSSSWSRSWDGEVYPSEREVTTDATSGARLVFVTNDPGEDTNLYFHQRSWLPDGSLLFFTSNRNGRPELFGYIEATGELVRIQPPEIGLQSISTAGRDTNRFYVTHDEGVYEWEIHIEASAGSPTQVRVEERRIAELPEGAGSLFGLNESSEGKGLTVGYWNREEGGSTLLWIDKASGESKEIAQFDARETHLQSSWETPGLVMVAKPNARGEKYRDRAARWPSGELSNRMWLADLTDREPWPLYPQTEDELVTHECWWTGDRVTFCAGENYRGDAEEAHVKVIDTRTGIARIIGAGVWWPSGTAVEISKRNWWHCAGSPDGRWVAADNWHGDIGLFSAKTSRTRILTSGHRTYGSGAHPHVGWDPKGGKVVFASMRRGNSDLCIAEIPEGWSEE
jgi:hypothetical protein